MVYSSAAFGPGRGIPVTPPVVAGPGCTLGADPFDAAYTSTCPRPRSLPSTEEPSEEPP